MSDLRRGSSESRTSNPITSEEESDVQLFRSFIQECKSLGNTPEASTASSGEVVSESFVDALSNEEINEIRKKVFRYWEKSTQEGEKPEIEVDESKMDVHQESDPKIQDEEAVPSFEDVKSEVASTTESHRDIGDLVESELRNMRHAKLSEGESQETTESGKLPRSEAMDFKDILKSADLPVSTDRTSSQRKRQLPVLRRTDALEIVLRIYEFSNLDSVGVLQCEDAKETDDVGQAFRKRLVIEMRIMYSRLHRAPRGGAHSSIIEESENSSSSFQTKDSFSPSTVYPGETTGTAAPRGAGDSISSSVPNQPSVGSGNSNSTVPSDDTLYNISSIVTESDSSGARGGSVGNLQDVDSLSSSKSLVLPQLVVENVSCDPSDSSSENRGAAGPAYLTVPQVPGLPSSSSTENAQAESIHNDQIRREQSPRDDDGNENAPKRRAT